MKKELPKIQPESGKLFALPYEALKWELLKTALELKVFDQLSEPVSTATVSDALQLHPQNTEYMLNALVALGCLKKEEGLFCNTAQTENFLKSGRDTSLGDSILYMAAWIKPMLDGGLLNCVRNGPPPPQDMIGDTIWEKGARVSVNHSRCGRAQMLANVVTDLPEFSSFKRMLDMGAGPGILGIAVVAKHPLLECILFDQPAVCRVADEVIAEYGVEDRVKTKPGSYMDDDIGSGYDFVMANFTLNFYRDRLDEIMRKVYEALNPGGVFVVTSDGIGVDGTAPVGTVFSWLSTAMQGYDMSFRTGLVCEHMQQAGFVATELQTLSGVELEAHGPIELTIGQKK